MTTKTLRISLLVAMSLALTCFASDHQSGQMQPRPSIKEALKSLKLQHRFDSPSKKPANEDVFDNNVVPDLQVGGGDGIFVETTTTPKPAIPNHKRVFPRKERRKREVNDRKSRSYAYAIHTPASISYAVSRPNTYKSPLPYYIPIFGTSDSLPAYYPLKYVLTNAEFPMDNPRRPLNEAATTEGSPTSKMILRNRFAEPVWGSRPVDSTAAPITSTRRSSRPNTSTFPPLVHRPDPNLSAVATARPIRSITSTTSTTSPALPAEVSAKEKPVKPKDHCVWAIINCCSAGSKVVNQSCFERLGCPGPFWGKSPCEGDIARIAIEYSLNHFQSK